MCIIILLTKPTSALSVKRTKLWTDKHAGVSSTHLSLTLSLHLRNLIEIFHAWCIYFRQDLATNMPKSFPKAYQNQWNKKSPTLNWRLRFYRLSATLLLLSSVVEEDGVAELGDGRGRRIFFFLLFLEIHFVCEILELEESAATFIDDYLKQNCWRLCLLLCFTVPRV